MRDLRAQEKLRDVYLVGRVTVPCDAIGADNCSECMNMLVLLVLLYGGRSI